ncbi:LiaF transmembrane domain-containing protein [Mucilaginibacter defluvii]|uniref:LiaF transmembrane domain-containing protein n=1 Tax=Mucilaginibacter defluvii TaxID=1196019 RepID=A0ABP9FZF6_9SPHI
MRSDKLMTGLVLVLIGVAYLLAHFGYADIHWMNFWRLWPIFLVIAGVNLIFANNKSGMATAIKAIVLVGGLAVILFADTGSRYFWEPRNFRYNLDEKGWHRNDNDDDDDDGDDNGRDIVKVEGNSNFKYNYSPDIKIAQLNISGGAATYKLEDSTSSAELFSASTKEFLNRYEFTNSKTDSLAVLNFKMRDGKGRNGFKWDSDHANQANFRLSTLPVWDININSGASEINFDLSKFKVRKLDINAGAASCEIKLGMPLATTNVDVSAAASEVKFRVPEGAACSIITQSGLSQNNIDGFTKVGDNRYETPGFASAKNKMYIKMKGGISDFNVSKY